MNTFVNIIITANSFQTTEPTKFKSERTRVAKIRTPMAWGIFHSCMRSWSGVVVDEAPRYFY